MFSERTAWRRDPNELSRKRAALERAGRPILDLAGSNPAHAGFRYPEAFYQRLFDAESAGYVPDPRGLPAAREAVAGYYRARGRTVDPARLWLGTGTSELLTQLLWLLCDPGDAILTPRPGYPLFEYFGDLAGVERMDYPLVYDGGWRVDLAAVEDQLDRHRRVRAVVAVSPNNPTGNFLKRDELAALETLCAARGLALIVDEVFADYPLRDIAEGTGSAAGDRNCLCFVVSGLSKVAALPQFKLAWGVVGGPAADAAEAIARLEIIADSFLSVASPIQRALPTILAEAPVMQECIRARARSNLALVRRALRDTAVTVLDAEGGWSVLLRLPAAAGLDDAAWADRLLEETGVWVQPGYWFDWPDDEAPHWAISLLTPEEILNEGLTRMSQYVQGRDFPASG
jgi:alanine-synthesizing transaminase